MPPPSSAKALPVGAQQLDIRYDGRCSDEGGDDGGAELAVIVRLRGVRGVRGGVEGGKVCMTADLLRKVMTVELNLNLNLRS